ncbi:hypothetical protein C8F04DRAFT_1094022 [Mycena alexandri]|uniref:Lysine-specific metallo-endopeptidase domain-containing protein n=1 Tax=Mycena alexandri TaxID=1745969 RepID=A0AAD6X668_9AGAR|nr:hypothetical protein C8F04DRAFT_1094022 [Mycena alexandri]
MISASRYVLGLILLLALQTASASPFPGYRPRAASTVKVLVQNTAVRTSSRATTYCSEAQVTSIKQAIRDLQLLAGAAEKVLSATGAFQSSPVKAYLGDITANALTSLVNLRYTNVKNFWAGVDIALEEVTDTTAEDNSLYLYCPPSSTKACSSTYGTSYAFASIKGEADAMLNEIAFCPKSFEGHPLADQTRSFQRQKTIDKFTAPSTLGLVLLHESQHSITVMQTTDMSNVLEDVNKASALTPQTCSALDPADKLKNAENVALLAFVAYAGPDRFT